MRWGASNQAFGSGMGSRYWSTSTTQALRPSPDLRPASIGRRFASEEGLRPRAGCSPLGRGHLGSGGERETLASLR